MSIRNELGLAAISGLAALGCGGRAAPTSDAYVSGATALELTLAATHTNAADGRTFHATWSMVADLAFDATGSTGWVAINGLVVDGQTATDAPVTRAAAVTGTAKPAGVTFAPFTIVLPDLVGSVDIDELVIEPSATTYTGTAKGTFHARDLDQIDDWMLTGTVTGGPDQTDPRAFAAYANQHPVALESVAVAFSEPVDLSSASITAATPGTPLTLATTPTVDPVSGKAIGCTVVPGAYWTSSSSVTVAVDGIVDVAGHSGGGSANVAIPPLPDPSANLGFEALMTGWLARSQDLLPAATPSVMVYEPNGPPVTVSAPVGTYMGHLLAGSTITGFLVPPAHATSLSLDLALINEQPVVNLQNANRGLFVEIVTLSGSRTLATGGDLPRPTQAQDAWTGFHPITIALPSDATAGFWLTVRAGDYEPPINSPEVLVDDIHF